MQHYLRTPGLRIGALLGAVVLMSGMLLLTQPTSARAANTSVSIVDNSFSPQSITIAMGDTVTWTNNGTMNHTVTADDGSFTSGTLSPGNTYSHTFTSAGTFRYYCQFHGGTGGVGMSGTVVVNTSSSSTSSTANSTSTTNNTSTTTATSTATGTGTSTSATTTSAAPTISNGSVIPNNTGAVITWTTNINSDAQVSYGLTTAYTTTTASNSASTTNHSVTIAGLAPGTLYHFMAMSNAGGATGMSPDETFTTTNTASTTGTGTSTSTATSTPSGTGTGTSTTATTTPPIDTSTLSGQITHLEAVLKMFEMELQAIFQRTGVPIPPGGNGGGTPPPPNGGPMTSTIGTVVYADNYSVAPGAAVHFNGSGYRANENILIQVNGVVVGTAKTDANGSFTVSGNAPNTQGDTTYWFTGQNSGNSDSVMITVDTGSNP
jgi:plastocyanin